MQTSTDAYTKAMDVICRTGPQNHLLRGYKQQRARLDEALDFAKRTCDDLVVEYINREITILNIQHVSKEGSDGGIIWSQCTFNELAGLAKSALGSFRWWTTDDKYEKYNCEWQWNDSTGGDGFYDIDRDVFFYRVAIEIMGCDCPVEQWHRDND